MYNAFLAFLAPRDRPHAERHECMISFIIPYWERITDVDKRRPEVVQ